MDRYKNPYVPGAGTRPPEISGRQDIIETAENTLERIKNGIPEKSMILVGLRGVGKTVLLNKIREIAETKGYLTEVMEAQEGKPFIEVITPFIRRCLLELNNQTQNNKWVKEGLGVLKSFMQSAKMTIQIGDIGLSIEPMIGKADTGDLETDLPDMLLALGKAADQTQKPIAIIIDEMQYLSSKELGALIISIHNKIIQSNLPIVIIGAGLPQIHGLAGDSKSYAERLFTYPTIGALTDEAASDAICNPARQRGVTYTDEAVKALLKETEKYPYFIQQWAYEAWNIAENNQINLEDVERATDYAIQELDKSFFQVRFDRCAPREKRYMLALAELGEGEHRSSDIAEKFGKSTQSVAPTRDNLIKKGMIYSPNYGKTAFTVPRFHEYMKRKMERNNETD